MNGEPSYEDTGRQGSLGWWQGHEAWSDLCAGAFMGVAYGAASSWRRLHPDEPVTARTSWPRVLAGRDALDFVGSRYVGLVGKIVDHLP